MIKCTGLNKCVYFSQSLCWCSVCDTVDTSKDGNSNRKFKWSEKDQLSILRTILYVMFLLCMWLLVMYLLTKLLASLVSFGPSMASSLRRSFLDQWTVSDLKWLASEKWDSGWLITGTVSMSKCPARKLIKLTNGYCCYAKRTLEKNKNLNKLFFCLLFWRRFYFTTYKRSINASINRLARGLVALPDRLLEITLLSTLLIKTGALQRGLCRINKLLTAGKMWGDDYKKKQRSWDKAKIGKSRT